ncbi:uncharacterized protein [Ambystoma mexicanum]|uniref:uncharacterized protein isoform X2 n=1 Tax=Ambystoma mexicanum TaxID=8296 RepID=UPI0037E76842
MSKKRRKHCRNRKCTENTDWKSNEHLPVCCKCEKTCQKGIVHLKEEKENSTSQNHLKTSAEKSKNDPNAYSNGHQSMSNEHKDRQKVPDNMADNIPGRGEPRKCHATPTGDLPDEVIAVVTLHESNASETERIIFQRSPRPVATSHSSTGPITIEEKCDCLSVNVELKKGFTSNGGAHLLIDKRKCPKKSRSYHDRQHQRSQCYSYHQAENTHDVHGKREPFSPNATPVTNMDSTLLKVSITGKDIEVNYNNSIQNVVVHIEPNEHCSPCDYRAKKRHSSCNTNDTDYPVTDGSYSSCPMSDLSHPESKDAYSNYTCPPRLYSSSTPPSQFADCKELYANTIRGDECQLLTNTHHESSNLSEPPSLFVANDEPSLLKELQSLQLGSNEASTLPEEPYLCLGECGRPKLKDIVATSCLGDTKDSDQKKEISFECNQNADEREKNSISSETCISTHSMDNSSHAASLHGNPSAQAFGKSKLYLGPKAARTVRRKTFPEAINCTFLSYQRRRDSILAQWSPPALKMAPVQEQSAESGAKDSDAQDAEDELDKSLSCSSSLSSHLEAKPSQARGSSPSGHERALSLSEPEDREDDVFLNDIDEALMGRKENMDIDSFHSWPKVNSDLKKKEDECEPLSNLSEEHPEFTESGFDEETLDSDNHNDVHEVPESRSTPSLVKTTSFSEVPITNHNPEKDSSKSACSETHYSQPSAFQSTFNVHPYIMEHEVKARRRRGSVVTVVTGEQEQRVIIQGESQGAAEPLCCEESSICQKDCKPIYSSRKDSILMPVSDTEEPEDKECQSCFEVQSMFQNSLVLEDVSLPDTSTAETSDSLASPENDTTFVGGAIIKEQLDDQSCPIEDVYSLPEECKANEKTPGTFCDSATSLAFSEPVAFQAVRLVKSDSESYDQRKAETLQTNCQKGEVTRKQFGKKDSKSGMANKHLKLPNNELVMKDSRGNESAHEEGSDRWAKRRKQFKESKHYSSTGGSSAASNITEESVNSEDTRSVDLGFRADCEERTFYSENFHSASWIFRGDDVSPGNSPRCLSKRPRPVASNYSNDTTTINGIYNLIPIWMVDNGLALNGANTGIMIADTAPQLHKLSPKYCLYLIAGYAIATSPKVKTLGVILNQELNMKAHVNSLVSTTSYYLKCLTQLRPFLNPTNCATIARAIIGE